MSKIMYKVTQTQLIAFRQELHVTYMIRNAWPDSEFVKILGNFSYCKLSFDKNLYKLQFFKLAYKFLENNNVKDQ